MSGGNVANSNDSVMLTYEEEAKEYRFVNNAVPQAMVNHVLGGELTGIP